MPAIYGFFGDPMIIAVDEAVPYWKEAFSDLGTLRPYSAKELRPADVRDADILIVRTVTPVNAPLLEGSLVRFVGAASAGTDHIDQEYLKARGIHFSYAAGCNANSVSEYIVTALHIIASRKGWNLKNKSLAVVGVGNVGSRVAKKARALGMDVLLCDPPLRDSTGDAQYRLLDDVLGADILSFHVPLAFAGPYPTWHMVNRRFLDRLSPEQFLLNSSRGPIFDSREVKAALLESRIGGVVIDVWEEEPRIDYSLLELADVGTPHIAGNALDGKIQATEMIRDALFAHFKIIPSQRLNPVYPADQVLRAAPEKDPQTSVLSVLLQAFDLQKQDADLRTLQDAATETAAEGFERLRTRKPLRPEFRHFIVDLDKRHIHLADTFAALGFGIKGTGIAE
ncbi:MAG TPA: 4-phosphoerythronate dehydrogenase [Acidobacteriota bacterium]|nr:4-phosphoerythronate dehydrogenase [Acidobacteriota bacterium]